MNERTDLARIVTDWLAGDAPPRASERVLAAAIARVAVTPQRRTLGMWLMGERIRISPTLRMALLGALLALALLGGALIAAYLLREQEPPPPTGSYEAVFLRTDEVTRPATQVVVVGVDSDGNERQIIRLQDAVLGPDIAFFPPEKIVSPSGLLALSISRDAGRNYHLEILDLGDPRARPVVVERLSGVGWGSAFWGPGDQLAIAGYEWWEDYGRPNLVRLHFVEARTGARIEVERPLDLEVLGRWAADGSGVLVIRQGDGGEHAALAVQRADGSIGEATEEDAEGVRGRRYRAVEPSIELWAGADMRALVSPEGVVFVDADDGREELLRLPAGVEVTDAAWAADGLGFWLVTRQSGGEKGNGVDERVERWTPDSGRTTVTTAGLPVGGHRSFAWWRGLAPDDSMLVVSQGGWDGPVSTVVLPDSGASFEIEGWFAGWLEVDR